LISLLSLEDEKNTLAFFSTAHNGFGSTTKTDQGAVDLP
jgi:hypothetical protein